VPTKSEKKKDMVGQASVPVKGKRAETPAPPDLFFERKMFLVGQASLPAIILIRKPMEPRGAP
jgi:hypothetical protein